MADNLHLVLSQVYPALSQQDLEQAADLLRSYERELARFATQVNLISSADLPRLQQHHILPSVALGGLILDRPRDHILDVGSGGGLPAIPLSILFTQSQFTLVESRRRRANFLRHCVRQLDLRNVRVRHARVEDIDDGPFDIATSRAVGGIDHLRKVAGAKLHEHGCLITTISPDENEPAHGELHEIEGPGSPIRAILLERFTCG